MPFCPQRTSLPSTITKRQLFKLEIQEELETLQIEILQQQHNLLSLWFEHFKAAHYAVASNEEKEKKVEDDLEDTQEEIIVEATEGEMLLSEPKWDDSEEDKEVNFNLPPKYDEDEEEPGEVLEEESEETTMVVQGEIIIPTDEGESLELPLKESKYLSPFLTLTETPHIKQFGESIISSPNSLLTISLSPHLLFLMIEPLTKKFCHKDKWKERTLVL